MSLLEQIIMGIKKKEKVKINKEGAEAFIEDVVRSIVLQGLSLNLSISSYYYNKEEKLDNFLRELERLKLKEKEWFKYLVGIALYLKENQRKLSPVVILAYLIFLSNELNVEQRQVIKELMDVVLDNPKRIYELLLLIMMLNNKAELKVLPAYIRRKIKDILETYDYYVLLNNKLSRKPIKLRDMLKILSS